MARAAGAVQLLPMSSDSKLVGDAWGGLAAMLVALPSAIAFGVTIYSPLGGSYAAYGALAGILGATALGLVAPVLGGTNGSLCRMPFRRRCLHRSRILSYDRQPHHTSACIRC